MTDRTVVITGASDGIGAAGARELARRGEHVVVVGRDPEKTRAVAEPIGASWHVADFTSLDEVRALAERLRAGLPRIDVLVNNAGGIMGPPERTVDGFERTLQVNHLAPFLLTTLLLDVLLDSGAAVLNTSSAAARLLGHVDLDDLNRERGYSPERAYGDTKLMNVLFTRELDRRFAGQGLASAAFHPGIVATNFAAESSSAMRWFYRSPLRRLAMVSAERGADTMVWLASGVPGPDWTSGAFYARRRIRRTNPQADDAALARGLWERSAGMVGLE